ncbi:MAG: class I SAM-dependent methyltransferase, partial [Desulfovibrio sp.]|nr:class I SAM-dependent methyltransferase [Desulfovibrio sp.]
FTDEAWFVFCHSDWEVKENIVHLLETIDKNCFYGNIGCKFEELDDEIAIACFGYVEEESRDGKNYSIITSYNNITGTVVDIIDAMCLIVHSSLVEKYNLQFDNKFIFDFVVEDFVANGRFIYNIDTRILSIKSCHHSWITNLNDARVSIHEHFLYFQEKYIGCGLFYCLIGVINNIYNKPFRFYRSIKRRSYTYDIFKDDYSIIDDNSPYKIMSGLIKNGSCLFDVGCNAGHFGAYLHDYKNCKIVGLEFDENALKRAVATGRFENVHQADLNSFDSHSLPQYHKKFDYVVFADVLEHLYNPQEVLNKFSYFLRDGGHFVLSIPNIGHGSIKASLLMNKFDYQDGGLLDRTHIRFFTNHTIPDFLSDIALKICYLSVNIKPLDCMIKADIVKYIPLFSRILIAKDKYSHVWQYVLLCEKYDSMNCYKHNRKMMNFTNKHYKKIISAQSRQFIFYRSIRMLRRWRRSLYKRLSAFKELFK